MTPTGFIFLSIGIYLMMDTGNGVSGAGENLKCIYCNQAKSEDCNRSPNRTTMSVSCSEIFKVDESTEAASTSNGTMTFDEDWKNNKKRDANKWKKDTKWVCVKQEVYVASKFPPGVTTGKKSDSWEYGSSIQYENPTYVSRFCGLIGAEALKSHRASSTDELGGKFAIRITYCETDHCNLGLKLEHSMGIILLVAKLIQFLGGNY